MKKHLIGYALLLCIAASAVLSCGEKLQSNTDLQDSDGQTAAASVPSGENDTTEQEKSALEGLPTEDFGGYTFHVYAVNDGGNNRHYDIGTEGRETGELFNDLVYKRNRAVEEKYNIRVDVVNDDYDTVTAVVRKQVQGGLGDYDLYFADSHVAKLAAEGFFAELHTIDNLNLTNPWWSRNALDSLSIGGNIYFMTGDINPTTKMSGGGLVFNQTIFQNNDLAYPYDMVREGKWTYDAMFSLCKDATKDINGDGELHMEDDMYSMSGWCAASPYAFFYGLGGTMSEKNADDTPVLAWDVDRYSTIYDKMYELIIRQKSYFVTDVSLYETTYSCFTDGHAYFTQISLLTIDRFLRDMKDNYGILPMPKLDESQKTYRSYVNAASNTVMIPSNAKNPARTGMITEALAAGAYDMITPSLYEIITKSRNVRDADSAEMVTIITDNIVYDLYYLNLLDNFSVFQEMLVTKSENIASTLESRRTASEKALEKLVSAFQSMS